MTTVQKRELKDAIDICVRGDLFTPEEAAIIFQICNNAISRGLRDDKE